MLSTCVYVFVFLPFLVLVWRLVAPMRRELLDTVLLFFSLGFIGWCDWRALMLVLMLTLVNYVFGLSLAEPGERDGTLRRRGIFLAAVVVNLLPLVFLRLVGWAEGLAPQATAVFSATGRISPAAPAVAFWLLLQIGWLSSIYRRQVEPEGVLRHVLFSSFFPAVLAGPVLRYEQMGPQFDRLDFAPAGDTARGLFLIITGLAKKIVLADGLMLHSDALFTACSTGTPVAVADAWAGIVALSFGIYFDFSAYADMAMGAGALVGLRLPENFRSPYRATGLIEFWRRWHVTLSAWTRDCLFVPLAGPGCGLARQCATLFLTVVLASLWYGTGMTFAVWGAACGVLLCVNALFRSAIRGRALESVLQAPPFKFIFGALTFLVVSLGWVLFRAEDWQGALSVYGALVGSGPSAAVDIAALAEQVAGDAAEGTVQAVVVSGQAANVVLVSWRVYVLLAVAAAVVFCLPNVHEILYGRPDGSKSWIAWSYSSGWSWALALVAALAIINMDGIRPFLF